MPNLVKPAHLESGALWTFVHRDGSTVEYVFDRVMQSAGGGLGATVALTNPATGKQAMVSEKWLREGEIVGGPHWLPKAEAAPVTPADVAA